MSINLEKKDLTPQPQRIGNPAGRLGPVIDQPTRLKHTADILTQLAEGELLSNQTPLMAGSQYYRHRAAIEKTFPSKQPAPAKVSSCDLETTLNQLTADYANAKGGIRWKLAETLGVVGNIIAMREQQEAAEQARRDAEQRQIEQEIKAAQRRERIATTRRWTLRSLAALTAVAAGGGGAVLRSNHQTEQEQIALEAAKKANKEAEKKRIAEQEKFEQTHRLEGEGELTPISFGNYKAYHPKYDPRIEWEEVNEPGSVYTSETIKPPDKQDYGRGILGLIGLKVINYLNTDGQNEIIIRISSNMIRDQERLLRKNTQDGFDYRVVRVEAADTRKGAYMKFIQNPRNPYSIQIQIVRPQIKEQSLA